MQIQLPATHVVTKGPRSKEWLAEVSIDVSKLNAEIIAKLAIHGLHQKIADSASQSQTLDEATASMNKAIDALLNGEWSTRGQSTGVDEFTRIARIVVRQVLKDKFGAKSVEWAKFTGLPDDEQMAKLDANFAKNEGILRPIVEKRIAEKREKISGVEFDI